MISNTSRYDYELDPHGDTTGARLCRLVGHDRRVLELGCAAGAMSAVLRKHYGCAVVGVEQDAAALESARPYCETVIQANLDDETWPSQLPRKPIDTVLAADVLEHLRDPFACLRQARDLLGPGGELVVSVPNIAHAGVVAALLNNDFPYRDTGLLDRTHIHFFTSLTLGSMLHQAGFQVIHTETVDTGAQHPEFHAYWQGLPDATQKWLADWPVGRPYQIIMQARVAENAGAYIDSLGAQSLAWLQQHQTGSDKAVLPPGQAQSVQVLQDALKQAQTRADNAESALNAITRSRSWRITAPLRWLVGKRPPRG